MIRYIFYYTEKGGLINLLIFGVCFVILFIGMEKLIQFWLLNRQPVSDESIKDELKKGSQTNNEFIRLFMSKVRKEFLHSENYTANMLKELLFETKPRLESGLTTMAAWIAVAPLLGLLGTVVGMVKTFAVISEFGIGNPHMLSEGISLSLLTTQAGLLVAFPCMLFHNFLVQQKNNLLQKNIVQAETVLRILKGEQQNAR